MECLLVFKILRGFFCVSLMGTFVVYSGLDISAVQGAGSTVNTDTDVFNAATISLSLVLLIIEFFLLCVLWFGYTVGVWDGKKRKWREYTEGIDSFRLLIYTLGICVEEGLDAWRVRSFANANKSLWISTRVVNIFVHLCQLLTVLSLNGIDLSSDGYKKAHQHHPYHQEAQQTGMWLMGLNGIADLCWLVVDAYAEAANVGNYSGWELAAFAAIYPCIINFRLNMTMFWYKKWRDPGHVPLNHKLVRAPMVPPFPCASPPSTQQSSTTTSLTGFSSSSYHATTSHDPKDQDIENTRNTSRKDEEEEQEEEQS